jgi:hypothetical protein
MTRRLVCEFVGGEWNGHQLPIRVKDGDTAPADIWIQHAYTNTISWATTGDHGGTRYTWDGADPTPSAPDRVIYITPPKAAA